jgi:nicotinamidase-related amidase
MNYLTKDNTVLVVIDIQEKLMPAMSDKETLENKTTRLVKGMKVFNIPTLVTQQYTKGIGPTIPSIAEALGEFQHIEKSAFSCMRIPEFAEQLKALDRKNVVVCGVEAHICVEQTALQLLDAGYNVYIPADCVSSRDANDKLWALARMGDCGAGVTSYESILYEILQDSKAPEFKAISAIVK